MGRQLYMYAVMLQLIVCFNPIHFSLFVISASVTKLSKSYRITVPTDQINMSLWYSCSGRGTVVEK